MCHVLWFPISPPDHLPSSLLSSHLPAQLHSLPPITPQPLPHLLCSASLKLAHQGHFHLFVTSDEYTSAFILVDFLAAVRLWIPS